MTGERITLHEIKCPNCGATISRFNPFALTCRCPNCDKIFQILGGAHRRDIPRPERIFPFKVNAKQFHEKFSRRFWSEFSQEYGSKVSAESTFGEITPFLVAAYFFNGSSSVKAAAATDPRRLPSGIQQCLSAFTYEAKDVEFFSPHSVSVDENCAVIDISLPPDFVWEKEVAPYASGAETMNHFGFYHTPNEFRSSRFFRQHSGGGFSVNVKTDGAPGTVDVKISPETESTGYAPFNADELINEFAQNDFFKKHLNGDFFNNIKSGMAQNPSGTTFSSSYSSHGFASSLGFGYKIAYVAMWRFSFTFEGVPYHYVTDGRGQIEVFRFPTDLIREEERRVAAIKAEKEAQEQLEARKAAVIKAGKDLRENARKKYLAEQAKIAEEKRQKTENKIIIAALVVTVLAVLGVCLGIARLLAILAILYGVFTCVVATIRSANEKEENEAEGCSLLFLFAFGLFAIVGGLTFFFS